MSPYVQFATGNRGPFQTGRAEATPDEIRLAFAELNRRNIFHSLQTITEKEHAIAAAQLREIEEAKQRRNSLFLWGGVGLASVITAIIVLR